jgi:sulfatase modifying factor 1
MKVMTRRTKTLALFSALMIFSVLAYDNVVCGWSNDFSKLRVAVMTTESKRAKLEEKRNGLLEDYDEDHRVIKAVEDEILALAKEYPSLLTKAHQQLEEDIQACDAEIADCLEQGMKRDGKTVAKLETQKKELKRLLKSYPLNVVTPKTYDEVYCAFLHISEDEFQEAEAHVIAWNTSVAGKEAGDLRVIEINGVSYRFRWAPPGAFMMGSPETEEGREDDEALHKVTLSHGFWMLETEVTQAMWVSIMGTNPSFFRGVDLPVERVSWDDCQKFVRKLNNLGHAPASSHFALPTEAQWEYACRAGTKAPFSWGGSLNGDKANCNGTRPYGTKEIGHFLDRTTLVRKYSANPWGLFDMHGNVYEWCADWHGPYPTRVVTDPRGRANGSNRVMRGGSWGYYPQHCRSAYRGSYGVVFRDVFVGFRIVLVPEVGSIAQAFREEKTP